MAAGDETTITLPEDLTQFVREEARRGGYASSSAYVAAVLHQRMREEQDNGRKLKRLDEALERGLADAEAGRIMPIEDAFRRIRAEVGLPSKGKTA